MKRKLSLFLAVALLALSLASCAPTDGTPVDTTVQDSQATTQTDPSTEAPTGTPTEPETQADTAAPAFDEGVTVGGADLSEFTVVHSADMPEGQITALTFFIEQVAKATGMTLPVITDDSAAAAEHEIVIGNTNRENAAVT